MMSRRMRDLLRRRISLKKKRGRKAIDKWVMTLPTTKGMPTRPWASYTDNSNLCPHCDMPKDINDGKCSWCQTVVGPGGEIWR